jgi:hypothetical protein
MTDETAAEPAEPVVSNATRKAVDGYRRVRQLERDLDAARIEWQSELDHVPHNEQFAYFEGTEKVRDEYACKHAAPDDDEPEPEHPEETHDGTAS